MVYCGATSFCDLYFTEEKNHRQNKTFSPLCYCELQKKVFMALEVEWPAGVGFCVRCVCIQVFMWRGDGASAAGASWFCPALPCTL